MIKNVHYVNPDCLPVDALTLSVTNSGVIQQIKALDPYWLESRQFNFYERPPSSSNIVIGAIDAWKSKMEFYLDDLKWILGLEYHIFWSTVLYHSSCMDALVSFLQESDPPYLPPHESREVRRLYEEIRRHSLVVFSRLITNKESKTKWMSNESLADIIYNKFIFTIPIIWDLCLTYGADNIQHISRLVTSVYSIQPQYEKDTAAALVFVKEVFKFIILQVNKDYDNVEPPNLPETFQGFSEIRRPSTSTVKTDKLTFDTLRDLIMHLVDTSMTLRIFIQAHPDSVAVVKKVGFINSVVQLYEYGIPEMYIKLEELGNPASIAYTEVEGYIDIVRCELVDIFKETVAVYKSLIFSGDGNISSSVENYLTTMMDGLSEKLLIKDYHAICPVHEDIDMLKQVYPEIDTVKTDFILQAIYSNLDEPVPENLLSNHTESLTNGHLETIDHTNTEESSIKDNEIPDSVKEQSLISEVKDILPHLGDGFILKCLQHYGFNAERVINSVLEDNLAQPLRGLDTNLPIIPEDPVDKSFLSTGIQRLNVFDGDQFDIMTRDDVDLSKIHVGKRKSKYKDLKDLLDDKKDVVQMMDIYKKYDMVCDEVALYSDEYDDSYDAEEPAPAADCGEEVRRPFVTPRVLRKEEPSSSEYSAEDEPQPSASAYTNNTNNTNHTNTYSRNKPDFCVNPEEIRAKREAHFQARRGRGQRPQPQTRSTDVTGKPKGQGQEKEVLANRDRKEKHKSSRGNHNRRGGAQWKRSQGMMPS